MKTGSQRPRLSLLPDNIDSTEAGDEVIEFAARFGLHLDDWQQWVVRNMCAETVEGAWAATQSVLLVPRQSGKSAILEALEMASLFLWEETHVIYSAHLGKTATDHMRRINRHMQSTPDFRRQARMLTGKGDERVETNDGRILEFITRGKKTARGGSPNRVFFDEAMFLTDEQIQAMVPSLSAQSMNEAGGAQMIYASSAPIAESQVLHRLRKRAIDDSPDRMFFAEWSVDAEADPNDRDNWYQANPGLGVRISEEWIADNEAGVLSNQAFAVERLGIPEMPKSTLASPGPIDPDRWASLARVTVEYDLATVSLACVVAYDRSWTTIVAVGTSSDGFEQAKVVAMKPGTTWAPERLCELSAELGGVSVAMVKDEPLADAVALLGVTVVQMSGADQARSSQKLIDACSGDAPTLRHRGEPALTKSLEVAVTKPYGDGNTDFSSRLSPGDISPLKALTLAFGRLGVAAEVHDPANNVW